MHDRRDYWVDEVMESTLEGVFFLSNKFSLFWSGVSGLLRCMKLIRGRFWYADRAWITQYILLIGGLYYISLIRKCDVKC